MKNDGGSTTLWESFPLAPTERLVSVDGEMVGDKYVVILEGKVLQAAEDLGLGQRFSFQQEHESKQRTRAASKWFASNHFHGCQNVLPQGPKPSSPKYLQATKLCVSSLK